MNTSDVPGQVPSIDEQLWVELVDGHGRWYLTGNPHTFPGRFDVWSSELGHALTISKSDVTEASEAARWWIEGFLSGNEPTISEYLGVDPDDMEPDDDDAAWQRWHEALTEFRRTGSMIYLNPRPVRPMLVDTVNGQIPWVAAGGEIWRWLDRQWQVVGEQPKLATLVMPGTVCIDQPHDDEDVGDGYFSCVNCGMTTEILLP